MGAETSTNPCINGVSAPTFAFLEGSGNQGFFIPFSLRAKVAKEALEVSPGTKMDPHWVPIWEQNAVQKIVAQLPVGSHGAAWAPKAFQNTQGLIFIVLGVRFAGLGPLWVSVSLALDLDFVDIPDILPRTCQDLPRP